MFQRSFGYGVHVMVGASFHSRTLNALKLTKSAKSKILRACGVMESLNPEMKITGLILHVPKKFWVCGACHGWG